MITPMSRRLMPSTCRPQAALLSSSAAAAASSADRSTMLVGLLDEVQGARIVQHVLESILMDRGGTSRHCITQIPLLARSPGHPCVSTGGMSAPSAGANLQAPGRPPRGGEGRGPGRGVVAPGDDVRCRRCRGGRGRGRHRRAGRGRGAVVGARDEPGQPGHGSAAGEAAARLVSADLDQQLLTADLDVPRRVDADPDHVPAELQDGDGDVVPDHEALADPAAEHQHAGHSCRSDDWGPPWSVPSDGWGQPMRKRQRKPVTGAPAWAGPCRRAGTDRPAGCGG